MNRAKMVCVALMLAGCSAAASKGTGATTQATDPPTEAPTSPPTTQDVSAFLLDLRLIVADSKDAAAAAGSFDTVGLSAACNSLQDDSLNALSDVPSGSNVDVVTHANAAFKLYVKAGRDCVAGADNIDTDKLLQSIEEMKQGSAELDLATAAMNQ